MVLSLVWPYLQNTHLVGRSRSALAWVHMPESEVIVQVICSRPLCCSFRREVGWHRTGPVPLNPGAAQGCNAPVVVVEDHTDYPVIGKDRDGRTYIMAIDLDPNSDTYGDAVRAFTDDQGDTPVPGYRNAIVYAGALAAQMEQALRILNLGGRQDDSHHSNGSG